MDRPRHEPGPLLSDWRTLVVRCCSEPMTDADIDAAINQAVALGRTGRELVYAVAILTERRELAAELCTEREELIERVRCLGETIQRLRDP